MSIRRRTVKGDGQLVLRYARASLKGIGEKCDPAIGVFIHPNRLTGNATGWIADKRMPRISCAANGS